MIQVFNTVLCVLVFFERSLRILFRNLPIAAETLLNLILAQNVRQLTVRLPYMPSFCYL